MVKILGVITVVIGAVAAFFTWANASTRRAYARSTRSDVEAALMEFVSPESVYYDTWELFLAWPIRDPYLESIRQRCQPIADRHDEAARDHVRGLLAELREYT